MTLSLLVVRDLLESRGVRLARADPDRMSMSLTKIFPSPISPVRADSVIDWMAEATSSSSVTISILTLGTKSTEYSTPR